MKKDKKQKRKERKIEKLAKKAVLTTTDFFGITEKKKGSRFVYNRVKFYGYFALYAFLSIITCLMLAPYAYYKMCELRYNNTYISNKKIVFRGKMYEVYYQFTLGLILAVVLLFLLNVFKLYFLNDVLSHLPNYGKNLVNAAIAGAPLMIITAVLINRLFVWSIRNIFLVYDDSYSYLKVSYLKLSIFKAILSAVARKIASLLTVGFGEPLLLVIKERYIVNRQFISNKRLRFNGHIYEAYSWFLWRYFLIFITFGFYYPIYLHKTYVWITMHTYFIDYENKKRFLF